MRILVLTAFVLLSLPTFAQPALRATQLAEFADGLSQPHDAAFSPDGKLIYLTDMCNSRIQVLEAMTLMPVGSFGAGELSSPHDAEFDKSGRLLVADTGNDRVAIDEMKGAQATLVRSHQLRGALGSGKRGRAADAFHKPEVMLARAPYVWVVDIQVRSCRLGRQSPYDRTGSEAPGRMPQELSSPNDGFPVAMTGG